MAWWVEKTQVSEKTWESMGCYADGAGVRFTFEGHEAYKKRSGKEYSWVGTSAAEAPPLWPAPPDKMPEEAFFTEGESDAGTIQESGLGIAFASTKGAKANLPRGAFKALYERGLRTAIVCGDTDDPGDEFTTRLSREALGAGLEVLVVRLEDILDPFSGINDLNGVWRATGANKRDFKKLIERATSRLATRLSFRTVSEMEEIAEEEIKWLIPDLIAPGDKFMIAAPQKSLKSWLALELTRSLTTCSPFLKRVEWIPERELVVGFIQEEGAPSLWARRIAMLGISKQENALFSHRTGFRFTESSYTDELIASARDTGMDVLILDPLQRMMPGLDANSDQDTGVIWDEVFRIQQALPEIVVGLVHHANKQNRLTWESIRGSSRHAGEVDLGIFLERHPFEENQLRMWMDGRDIPQYLGTGESFEVKYKIDRDERIFEMDATEISVHVTSPGQAQGKTNRDRILKAVEDGMNTRTKIMHEVGLSDTTVVEHLKRLVADNEVLEIDNGEGSAKTYEITEEEKDDV
jgi:hypothetical protein